MEIRLFLISCSLDCRNHNLRSFLLPWSATQTKKPKKKKKPSLQEEKNQRKRENAVKRYSKNSWVPNGAPVPDSRPFLGPSPITGFHGTYYTFITNSPYRLSQVKRFL